MRPRVGTGDRSVIAAECPGNSGSREVLVDEDLAVRVDAPDARNQVPPPEALNDEDIVAASGEGDSLAPVAHLVTDE